MRDFFKEIERELVVVIVNHPLLYLESYLFRSFTPLGCKRVKEGLINIEMNKGSKKKKNERERSTKSSFHSN